jgi:hypothetical protein
VFAIRILGREFDEPLLGWANGATKAALTCDVFDPALPRLDHRAHCGFPGAKRGIEVVGLRSASATALTMLTPAPCPRLEGIACAASPTMAARPFDQVESVVVA